MSLINFQVNQFSPKVFFTLRGPLTELCRSTLKRSSLCSHFLIGSLLCFFCSLTSSHWLHPLFSISSLLSYPSPVFLSSLSHLFPAPIVMSLLPLHLSFVFPPHFSLPSFFSYSPTYFSYFPSHPIFSPTLFFFPYFLHHLFCIFPSIFPAPHFFFISSPLFFIFPAPLFLCFPTIFFSPTSLHLHVSIPVSFFIVFPHRIFYIRPFSFFFHITPYRPLHLFHLPLTIASPSQTSYLTFSQRAYNTQKLFANP